MNYQVMRCFSCAGLAAQLILVVGCTSSAGLPAPADQIESLPEDAVAAVTVSPVDIKAKPGDSDARTILFNAEGTRLGSIVGPGIYSNRVLGLGDGLVTATAEALINLTPEGRTDVPIGEHTIRAGTSASDESAAILWFDAGRIDGASADSFAEIDSGGIVVGSVPGYVTTIAHCGEHHYAISRDLLSLGGDQDWHHLYRSQRGGEPERIASWEQESGYRSAYPSMVCAPDGSALHAIYASPESRLDQTGSPGLSLVRISTADGARTVMDLDIGGFDESVMRGTMALVDSVLYWITAAGEVLSVPVGTQATGAVARASLVAELPGGTDSLSAIRGTTIAHIDDSLAASYSEFDLLTGERDLGPIPLPWLDELIDAHTKNRSNVLGMTGVLSLRD
ncbi:hypothetical protein [Lolliginicoccus levis]|uniref:hypothetical protein n=1 Tax=Lolliginicoccus levis TaxID=2919542 RepID=UPI00241F1FE0|nr:hypothetical protein [Lolliginicoccus levis]